MNAGASVSMPMRGIWILLVCKSRHVTEGFTLTEPVRAAYRHDAAMSYLEACTLTLMLYRAPSRHLVLDNIGLPWWTASDPGSSCAGVHCLRVVRCRERKWPPPMPASYHALRCFQDPRGRFLALAGWQAKQLQKEGYWCTVNALAHQDT